MYDPERFCILCRHFDTGGMPWDHMEALHKVEYERRGCGLSGRCNHPTPVSKYAVNTAVSCKHFEARQAVVEPQEIPFEPFDDWEP